MRSIDARCPGPPGRSTASLLAVAALLVAAGSAWAAQDAAEVPAELASARATMRTFLTSVNAGNFDEAARCLDWSRGDRSPSDRERLVRRLKALIDRMAWVDYAAISDQSDGPEYRFPPDAAEQPIVIARGADGRWRFTADTVARIDPLYNQWKDRPPIVRSVPWYRRMTPLGNEVWRIGLLCVAIAVSWIAGRILRQVARRTAASLEKRQRAYGAVVLQSLALAIVPAALVVGLRVGTGFLVLSTAAREAVSTAMAVLVTLAAGYAFWCLVDVVDVWLTRFTARTRSKLDDMLAPMLRTSLRLTLVVLVLVQVATILSDKPMTSIITGLGVGGLAIGLAAQDTVKNFFGSIMIFSDRPFELGDRIQVAGYDGTVETVGFRSTRIRTLDGHLVTMPNGELANIAIRNVSKRPNIRRIMNLGLTYDTSPEQLERAIAILQDVLREHEGMDPEMPPRVFFNEFEASSLNLFVIYWYHPADWWAYCEFSQRVNLEIVRRFNEAGIEFAFPSQTIYLAGTGGDAEGQAPDLGAAG